LLTEIGEICGNPPLDVLVGRARSAHAAWLADTFEPRRNVHAVAENVVAIDQHVAKTEADAI
jgi:hypothetical protein